MPTRILLLLASVSIYIIKLVKSSAQIIRSLFMDLSAYFTPGNFSHSELYRLRIKKKPEPAPEARTSRAMLGNCQETMNLQQNSPLFTLIPAEIRNKIFQLSLESSNVTDETHSPYSKQSMYYRPDYSHPKRINTALLQTCQRVHAEASLIPFFVNEHTFWCHRAPPHVREASNPKEYFAKMTPEQRACVQTLHFFTQQFFLEGDWGRICKELPVAPRKIKITLRHTDWWWWENGYPLGINPFLEGMVESTAMDNNVSRERAQNAWGYQFCHVKGLETLEIEFETVLRKKDQLDGIIERAMKWKFDQHDGRKLAVDKDVKVVSTWVGPKHLVDHETYAYDFETYDFDVDDGDDNDDDDEADEGEFGEEEPMEVVDDDQSEDADGAEEDEMEEENEVHTNGDEEEEHEPQSQASTFQEAETVPQTSTQNPTWYTYPTTASSATAPPNPAPYSLPGPEINSFISVQTPTPPAPQQAVPAPGASLNNALVNNSTWTAADYQMPGLNQFGEPLPAFYTLHQNTGESSTAYEGINQNNKGTIPFGLLPGKDFNPMTEQPYYVVSLTWKARGKKRTEEGEKDAA